MSTINSKKNKTNYKDIIKKYTTPTHFVNWFLIVMFAVCPFFYTNQFANIRNDKYNFFMCAVIACVVFIFVRKAYDYTNNKLIKKEKTGLINSLSITDKCFLAFLIVNIVSTLMLLNYSYAFSRLFQGEVSNFFSNLYSNKFGYALNGSIGRNNGLFLILAYTVIYFAISRFYIYKKYVLVIYVLASSLICGLAILNFFYVDPLGIFRNYSPSVVEDFISTIGNKNLMSSFTCLCLPVSFMLYITSKNTHFRIFYLVGVAFSFLGMLVSNSDSGYLGMAAFAAFAILYCIRRVNRIKDLLTTFAVMLFAAKLLRIMSLMYEDNHKRIDSFAKLIVKDNSTFALLILCVIIVAVLNILIKKNPELLTKQLPPFVFWIALSLIIIGIIIIGAMFIYYTFINTTITVGDFRRFFRFNNSWGTHRGYMWLHSFEIFKDANIMQKLFGHGPDLFKIAFLPYSAEMALLYKETTNAAHNEYIQILITNGILGLTAFLGMIIVPFVKSIKNAKENPICIVFAGAIICYAAQAMVNISQPITTPVLIIFISMLTAVIRKNSKDKKIHHEDASMISSEQVT